MAGRIDHEHRKGEVARRAMKLFAEVGYDNVTLIMIASTVGMARSVLYRYFRSKREVLDAAILVNTRSIMNEARQQVEARGKVADRLATICYRISDMLLEERAFLSAIFDFVFSMVRTGEQMKDRIASFTDGIVGVFERLVTEGVVKGEFGDDVQPDRAAGRLFMIFESYVLRIVLGIENSSAGVKRRLAEEIGSL